MIKTRMDHLKDEVFNAMLETANTKFSAASHLSQTSDISCSIPHPRSFKDILTDEEEILCLLCKAWFAIAGEGDKTSSH